MGKVIAVIMLALAIMLAGCDVGSASSGVREGERASDFQLQSLDGKTVSLSSFRGKPVLLNFWATWCGPCVGEMPYLQEIYKERSAEGLVVLAVNIGDPASQVNGFMQHYELSLPVLLDTRRAVAEQYNITGIPTTFFIDKNGIIRGKVVGAFPSKESIERYLTEIVP